MKPFSGSDETILKQSPTINVAADGRCYGARSKTMTEAIVVVLALFSASVFVAHALDAYRAG